MYHGTSLESAALIEQKGFKPSTGGLLGPGVYVSRNMQKAQQYRGSGGVILEVLVRVGLVCDIKPHTVPVPVGEKWKALRESNVNAVQTMVLAKDLVAEGWTHESPWHDAGYDTAWVPADCSPSVFRGGAGWSQGHKEETCVWDGSRISVQRRIVWDTDRTDVNEIEWMWWEDSNRVAAHTHRVGEWVPYSRQNSIMIESHYLARQTRGGQNEFVIRIEGGRKIFHEHTGLQYEINLTAMTQKNVMTGYERRLQRRSMAHERGAAALTVQCSIRVLLAKRLMTRRRSERILQASVKLQSVARGWFANRVVKRKRKDESNRRTCAVVVIQRAFRSCPRNRIKPVVLIDDEQEIETGE